MGIVSTTLAYQVQDMLKTEHRACIPNDVTTGKAMQAVVKFLDASPEFGHWDMRALVPVIFKGVWRCPRGRCSSRHRSASARAQAHLKLLVWMPVLLQQCFKHQRDPPSKRLALLTLGALELAFELRQCAFEVCIPSSPRCSVIP
jgi:hypothetical protein